MSKLVVGLGSEMRGDDGAGPAVARRVAARLTAGGVHVVVPADPLDLLDLWDGVELAVLIDAVRGGPAVGALCVLEPERADLRVWRDAASTHEMDVRTVLHLARALGRGPLRAVVVGIAGEDFRPGAGLSQPVQHALDAAAQAVLRLLGAA